MLQYVNFYIVAKVIGWDDGKIFVLMEGPEWC